MPSLMRLLQVYLPNSQFERRKILLSRVVYVLYICYERSDIYYIWATYVTLSLQTILRGS